MRKLLLGGAAAATLALGLGASPANAEAATSSYWISQRTAERLVLDAAETRYEGNGVTADRSDCRPQGAPTSGWRRYAGRWHRWTCWWEGTDEDGDGVYGYLRITGHSHDRYGYMPVYGGMYWG